MPRPAGVSARASGSSAHRAGSVRRAGAAAGLLGWVVAATAGPECRYRLLVDPTPGSEPFTAVVVPVREAETIVRRRALQVQPELLPHDRSTSAHITLLAPFLPPERIDDGVLAELSRLFADVTAFDFELTEVCEFPDGPVYLAPEPAGVFRRLTFELHHAFPEFPPYGGAFDDVVPHLTVPLAPTEDAAELRRALRATLPLAGHAVEADLVHVEKGNVHLVAALPFGTTAA